MLPAGGPAAPAPPPGPAPTGRPAPRDHLQRLELCAGAPSGPVARLPLGPGRAYRGVRRAQGGAEAAHGPDAGRAARLRDPARGRPHGPARRSEVGGAGGRVAESARRRRERGREAGGGPGAGPGPGAGRGEGCPAPLPSAGRWGAEGTLPRRAPLPLRGPQLVGRVPGPGRGAGGRSQTRGTRPHMRLPALWPGHGGLRVSAEAQRTPHFTRAKLRPRPGRSCPKSHRRWDEEGAGSGPQSPSRFLLQSRCTPRVAGHARVTDSAVCASARAMPLARSPCLGVSASGTRVFAAARVPEGRCASCVPGKREAAARLAPGCARDLLSAGPADGS